MDLNDIIRNLLDWVKVSNMTIDHLSIYSKCDGVYLELQLRKKEDGEQVAIGQMFYLGDVCCSENWDRYANDLWLNHMIEQLKRGNLPPEDA